MQPQLVLVRLKELFHWRGWIHFQPAEHAARQALDLLARRRRERATEPGVCQRECDRLQAPELGRMQILPGAPKSFVVTSALQEPSELVELRDSRVGSQQVPKQMQAVVAQCVRRVEALVFHLTDLPRARSREELIHSWRIETFRCW